MLREHEARTLPGAFMLVLLAVVSVASLVALILFFRDGATLLGWSAVFVLVVAVTCFFGLFMVNPNEAKVLQLFGNYQGTAQEPGLRWTNPFYTKRQRLAAGAELRERAAQGQRPRRQPDRDRGGGGLAGRRHGRGAVRRGRLRELRARPERVRAAEPGDALSLRRARSRARSRCAATPPRSPSSSRRRSRSGSRKAGVEVLEARISHLAYAPEIAAARCCGASRPAR